jgi:hypothetical protein
MDRRTRVPGLHQEQRAALIQASANVVQRTVAVEDGQDQGFHATATQQHVLGMGRNDRINQGRHVPGQVIVAFGRATVPVPFVLRTEDAVGG